MINYII